MVGTKWLTEDEQRDWRLVLRMCLALLDGLDADLSDDGLSLADYEVLVHLSAAGDDHLRMHELAELVLISKSRLTYRVDRLEAQGYLRREQCHADRRGYYAVLTDAGMARLREVAPRHVASVRRRLVDAMSADDFQTLGRLAEKVLNATTDTAAAATDGSSCPDLTAADQ